MAGRPSKLTPEVHKAIVDAVKTGATYATATALAGVDYDTFNRWMIRGAAAKSGVFFDFCGDVRRAEADLKHRMTAVLLDVIRPRKPDDKEFVAPETRAKYALEYLKRRDRAEWGDNVKIDVSALSDAEIMRLLGVAQQAHADDSPTS